MMNRSKSIKDIGDIYRAMQQASAAVAGQLNESVSTSKKSQKVKAKFPKDTFKKSEETVREPSTFKKGGPKNVKNLAKAKKNEKFSQKTKKVVKEDINNFMSIFDKLYEDVMKNDELNLNTGIGMGPEGSAGDVEDLGMDSDVDTDSEGDESPKDMLQKAIDLLQKVADSMEGEGSDEGDSDLEDLGVEDKDEDEDYEDQDDQDEDDGMYETTDIEKLPDSAGHKLQKGFAAAGNIKASSGKANASVTDTVGIETGKHPMDHKSELTNPSKNKVGSLKAGKSLFDQ